MDTLKILLGATVALLLGALGVSLYNQKGASQSAESLQTAELIKKTKELELELDRLQFERQRQALELAAAQAPPVVAPVAAPQAGEVESMKEQIAQLQAEKEKAAQWRPS